MSWVLVVYWILDFWLFGYLGFGLSSWKIKSDSKKANQNFF